MNTINNYKQPNSKLHINRAYKKSLSARIYRAFTIFALCVYAIFFIIMIALFAPGANDEQSIINSLITLYVTTFLIFTLFLLINNSKKLKLFYLTCFLGGFVFNAIFRAYYVTNFTVDIVFYKNLALFGVPLVMLLIYQAIYPESKR